MSRTVDLFISSSQSLDDLAGELAAVLGRPPLTATTRDGRPQRVFDDGEVQADLTENDFEDDRDMPFERYDYHLTIRGRRSGRTSEAAEQVAEQGGRRLFAQLRATARYPLLLVDDGQRKLDEFDPG